MSACHHCRVVPGDEDAQSLAKVTHHLVLVLAKVPRQLPPQPGNGLQAHLSQLGNERPRRTLDRFSASLRKWVGETDEADITLISPSRSPTPSGVGILRSRSGVRPSVWRHEQHYQSKSKKCKSHGSVPVVEHIGNEMDCQRNFCQLQGSCCTMDMERKLHMLNRSGPFIQCISGQIKHCSTP